MAARPGRDRLAGPRASTVGREGAGRMEPVADDVISRVRAGARGDAVDDS